MGVCRNPVRAHEATPPFDLCTVYLPPPVSKSMLEHFIANCNSYQDNHNAYTCFVGDFNLRTINWSELNNPLKTQHISSLDQLFIDFTSVNNLRQCNNVTNKNNRLLDIVLVDVPGCCVSEADPLSVIDLHHPPLEIQITLTELLKLKSNSITKINFHKADYKAINKQLKEKD